jgi:hypothetical protein
VGSYVYFFTRFRSATDYDIFRDALHMRGLDVAFYTHRSRYHTPDDDMPYGNCLACSPRVLSVADSDKLVKDQYLICS